MAVIPWNADAWVPNGWGGFTSGTPTTGSFTINANGDKIAFIVKVPKTGTLDKFEFRTGAVTNTAGGVTVSFQDIDPATGLPDGTQDQFRTAVAVASTSWIVPGLITSDGTNGGVKRSVTGDAFVCCVIEFTSFTAGDVVTIITTANYVAGTANALAYVGDASTGTYAKSSQAPNMALKYNDGYVQLPQPYVYPQNAINSRTFNNGSTPDERALRFQVPVALRLSGWRIRADLDGNADLVLYNAAGSVVDSVSLDTDNRGAATGQDLIGFWPTKPTLTPNSTYRVAVKPTSGTSLTLYSLSIDSSGLLAALWGGAQWYSSTRVDAGSWSDDQTEKYFIGLAFDGVDLALSGGYAHSAAYFG